MNYEQLFAFVAFAEHLNFTHAAARLHISQPALHMQIKKLGEAVGRPLYRRVGRALFLTPEGRQLAAFGREVAERGRSVLEELRGQPRSGPVVLASGQGAFLYLLGPAIRRFPKHTWPLRLVAMSAPDAIEAVREARAHLGVAALARDAVPADLESVPLREVGQRVVVPRSHRLARRRSVGPADLAGEPLVVAPAGSPHRVMLAQLLEAAGVSWSVAVEATGWELMLQFARYGVGIAVVNDFCPPPRGMVARPLAGAPAITYHLVGRAGSASKGAGAMRALILETVRAA
ncbi:MAG TPA: LysR family transcriptional regulator [Kofleriaceae bacterium]|nr:LysR family transcriptional regulator [Kofleriaceae bacterium]